MEISDPSKRSCDIPSCPSLDRKVSPQLAKLDQVWSHFPVLSLLFMFSDMYCNINNMYVFIICNNNMSYVDTSKSPYMSVNPPKEYLINAINCYC